MRGSVHLVKWLIPSLSWLLTSTSYRCSLSSANSPWLFSYCLRRPADPRVGPGDLPSKERPIESPRCKVTQMAVWRIHSTETCLKWKWFLGSPQGDAWWPFRHISVWFFWLLFNATTIKMCLITNTSFIHSFSHLGSIDTEKNKILLLSYNLILTKTLQSRLSLTLL